MEREVCRRLFALIKESVIADLMLSALHDRTFVFDQSFEMVRFPDMRLTQVATSSKKGISRTKKLL